MNRLLDLFCGAGGAAMGYHRAGFDEIVGVDMEPQPNYPFRFIQADALQPPVDLDAFDLIHASPPCQAYSVITPDQESHPDLVATIQDLLNPFPYVIENVLGAPLRRDLILCGSMFNLDIRRHRVFELNNFPLVLAPACNHKAWNRGRPISVIGHGGGIDSSHSYRYRNLADAQQLMETSWITTKVGIVEAVPPAYTEHIGQAFLEAAVGMEP